MPFATLVCSNYLGFDTGSQLDREGVFRLNIAVGRAAYERVAAEPDALADVAPPDLDARLADAETWGYVALEVWDVRHDDDMPRPAVASTAQLRGEQWDADDAEGLAARYPRLTERFG